MQEFDVVARIQELCQARSWTYYRLAKASGIPYSTPVSYTHLHARRALERVRAMGV